MFFYLSCKYLQKKILSKQEKQNLQEMDQLVDLTNNYKKLRAIIELSPSPVNILIFEILSVFLGSPVYGRAFSGSCIYS